MASERKISVFLQTGKRHPNISLDYDHIKKAKVTLTSANSISIWLSQVIKQYKNIITMKLKEMKRERSNWYVEVLIWEWGWVCTRKLSLLGGLGALSCTCLDVGSQFFSLIQGVTIFINQF